MIEAKSLQAFGIASVLLISLLSAAPANAPVELVSERQGSVTGADLWHRRGSYIHIRLESGPEISLKLDKSIILKHGDLVRVQTWRRRFIGYLTVYKKV
jgi:hypothetical protein